MTNVRAPAARAEALARHAHDGLTEKYTGDPYHLHLARVVALVDGDDAKAVAWLHDTLEDTALTADDLKAAGFDATVVDAVKALTKVKGEPYPVYMARLMASGSTLARVVKRADLLDHLRPAPVPYLPDKVVAKYEAALAALAGA